MQILQIAAGDLHLYDGVRGLVIVDGYKPVVSVRHAKGKFHLALFLRDGFQRLRKMRLFKCPFLLIHVRFTSVFDRMQRFAFVRGVFAEEGKEYKKTTACLQACHDGGRPNAKHAVAQRFWSLLSLWQKKEQ